MRGTKIWEWCLIGLGVSLIGYEVRLRTEPQLLNWTMRIGVNERTVWAWSDSMVRTYVSTNDIWGVTHTKIVTQRMRGFVPPVVESVPYWCNTLTNPVLLKAK